MEKAGFKVLAWAMSWGYRNVITSKKEVKKAADLKGLKIRTIPTKVFVAAINSMGANATPMNFGEIYTSLQSGVLDGYEHTAATTISFKMYEVACCMALTKHLMDPTFLVFSLAEWKKLSAGRAGRAAEGGERGRADGAQMAPQREGEALAEVKKLGMKVNEIDPAPLLKAALKAQDELAKEFGAEKLLEQIRKQARRTAEEARLLGASDRPRRRIRASRRSSRRCARSACCRSSTASCSTLAQLERGIPDLLPRLDRVPRHPDRLPARRAPVGRLRAHAVRRRLGRRSTC